MAACRSRTFDEAKAQALAAQQAQTVAQLTVEKTRIRVADDQILTPDQKTKLNAILDKREQRMKHHMQGQLPDQHHNQQNLTEHGEGRSKVFPAELSNSHDRESGKSLATASDQPGICGCHRERDLPAGVEQAVECWMAQD